MTTEIWTPEPARLMLAGDWRPVVGREGYLISSRGQIYSLISNRLLSPYVKDSGHLAVHLGRSYRRMVHHLVLEAFAGLCPLGQEALHENDNPTDNRWPENLRWGTRSENVLGQVRNGRHNNATKKFCPRQHEYTEENTFRHRDGRRECRTCKRERGKQ